HDYAGFSERELTYRRAMNYPPYASLAVLLVKDGVLDRARARAADVARVLRGLAGSRLQVLGPAPAPLERLRGHYRVQILLKAPGRPEIQAALADAIRELEKKSLRADDLVIDVDPMSTL